MILGFPTTVKWTSPPAFPSGSTFRWRSITNINLDNTNDSVRFNNGLNVGGPGVAPTPNGSLIGTDNDLLSNPLQASIFTDASSTTPYIYKDYYYDIITADVVSSIVYIFTYYYSCLYDCSYFANVYTGGWFHCDFIGACAGPPCSYPQYGIRGCCNDCYCHCYFPQSCPTSCPATAYNRATYKAWARYRYVPHSGFTNTRSVMTNFSGCSYC